MKFLKELQKRIFPTLIAFSALSVSMSAAFYSISGLSKLFAGASFEVVVMATSLEIAKLVIASLLYQYWSQLNKMLKIYLTIATVVLVFITSAGIYGFLSAAYQETATKSEFVDGEIQILEMKKERFSENRTFYLSEKTQIDQGITELRKGLSNNVIQYKDQKTGQLITTTSSANRKVLQQQLDEATKRRDEVSVKLENVTDSITSLDIKILEVQSNSELSGELGPLKYLSNLTNTPMNQIINILLLIIIFVFDPLAISLVIAANFAFNQIKKKKLDVVEDDKSEDDNDDNFWDEDYLDELSNINDKETIEKNIDDISKMAGQTENKIVKEEVKPLNPSEELIHRLQSELDKLLAQKEEREKINKLSEVIDSGDQLITRPKEEVKEVNLQEMAVETPNKRKLTYTRRDGGRNTKIDRI
jgi:hypothetical protein